MCNTHRSMWKRILLGITVLVAGFLVWVFWPTSAAGEVTGVAPPEGAFNATIIRDRYGVPHIRGATDADAAYGLAWAHSEDDFLTIQQTLLAARGDLATREGLAAAPVDYFVSLLGIWDAIGRGWETLDPRTRDLVDAYAAGINHYASEHASEAFTGLYPVTGQDVVAGFMQKAPLFYGLDGVIGELFSEESPQPGDPIDARARTGAYGSNVLAVSPLRSEEGQTMLAVNSHQPWTGPVAWYEAHIQSDQGLDMVGGVFPGMPVIAHGHNHDLGWAFTVSRPDLVDVYWLDINPENSDQYLLDGVWTDFVIEEVPIEVRLMGRITWTVKRDVLRSVHGPVIRNDNGSVYAIRYAAMDEVGMVEQLYRMNKAATFEEWKAALATQSGLPSFNIGYADRTGRIAYVHHGLFPERREGVEWSGLLDGSDSSLIWDSYMPLDDLPWVVDPSSGFIQNSNSSPFTATVGPDAPDVADFPDSMGIPGYETNRSLRSLELFGSDPSISSDEFLSYKWDMAYSEGSGVPGFVDDLVRIVSPATTEERTAVDVLRSWEPNGEQDNTGTALVVRILSLLLEGGADFDPSRLTDLSGLSGAEMKAAFTTAVSDLMKSFGRVDPFWGEANRLVRGVADLGLAGGPDLLHAVYGEWDDGRFEGIAGDSYVLVVTWDADGEVSSSSVHQFGAATLDEDSNHYSDQAALFARRQLKKVWFTIEEINANTERAYRPGE